MKKFTIVLVYDSIAVEVITFKARRQTDASVRAIEIAEEWKKGHPEVACYVYENLPFKRKETYNSPMLMCFRKTEEKQ